MTAQSLTPKGDFDVSEIEDLAWEVADYLFVNASEDGLNRQWVASIRMFLMRLPVDQVFEAAMITSSKRGFGGSKSGKFKYFCAICWSKIRELEAD